MFASTLRETEYRLDVCLAINGTHTDTCVCVLYLTLVIELEVSATPVLKHVTGHDTKQL